MELNDQIIQHHWRKYLEGHKNEFRTVYYLLGKRLILYCFGRFKTIDKADAEDIVSEAFIKLLELDYDKKVELRSVKAWLVNTVHKMTLNLLTYRSIREKKKNQVVQKSGNYHLEEEEKVIDHEYIEWIKETSLEVMEQKIWRMHNEGYKNDEIAQALQLNYQTVGNKLVKIRQKLNVGFRQLYFGNGQR